MARVVKVAEVRREELLDVALELFTAEGYDHASVEQITKRAGVAKGTFYHYFASKQDLAEQLVDRFASEFFEYLTAEMLVVRGDAPCRLRALHELSTSWKIERRDASMIFGAFLYNAENLSLRHELFRTWIDRTRPLLVDIIEQGVSERTFDVADARGTAGVILSIWYDWGDRIAERVFDLPSNPGDLSLIADEYLAAQAAQERILGVADGTLQGTVDIRAYLGTLLLNEPERA